jgi:hypothetical protein
MPKPRIRSTVRQMMAFIFCLGIILHLSLAAWRAHRYGGKHVHSAIFDGEFGPCWGVAVRNRPFWPSFWRSSTGLAWRDQGTCRMGGPAMMEMCELVNPEIRMPLGPYTFAATHTKEQVELFQQLKKSHELTAINLYNRRRKVEILTIFELIINVTLGRRRL